MVMSQSLHLPTLLRSIEAKKAQLEQFLPLPPATIKSLEDWFRVELTYTSNALEGNTLSRRETQMVVMENLAVEGKSLTEILEAKNHRRALDFVLNFAKTKEEISLQTILKIHQLILGGIDDLNAGRFRTVGVRIAGSAVILPNAAKIPLLMQEFIAWLGNSQKENKVFLAAQAHYKLVSLHPFTDGNGRTARLLMNLILLRNNYPPAVIKKEERKDYLDFLEKAQLGGSTDDYFALIYQAEKKSLDFYLETITGSQEEYLTVSQVAQKLQVHPESVRRWVRAGKLPALKLGGKYLRIKKGDLDEIGNF
jgi:excisionase family DNA binding protein